MAAKLTSPRVLVLLAGTLALAAAAIAVVALALPADDAPRCSVLPRSNPWNQRVDELPALHRSPAYVRNFGADLPLMADFTMPYTTVGRSQRRVPVRFFYRSDPGPYPIPRDAPVEPGVDRHVIVIDRDRCRLYELYKARRRAGGRRWQAGSGAIFDLRSNRLRPSGLTSADAAGLPIFPGLPRFGEVQRGKIDHAIRFTARCVRDTFVYPARHSDGRCHGRNAPPMGSRFRLRGDFDVSAFPPQAEVILTALQRYGMILADSGTPWSIIGAPSGGWSEDELATLDRVHGSDFEAVDTRSLPKPGL
jgi:hypothetical protein